MLVLQFLLTFVSFKRLSRKIIFKLVFYCHIIKTVGDYGLKFLKKSKTVVVSRPVKIQHDTINRHDYLLIKRVWVRPKRVRVINGSTRLIRLINGSCSGETC